jgi:hypothetical protein
LEQHEAFLRTASPCEYSAQDLWEDKTQREAVVESLKADFELRMGGLNSRLHSVVPA